MNKTLYARHEKATDALAAISERTRTVDKVADTAKYKLAGVTVVVTDYSEISAAVGVNTHKLLLFGITRFTSHYNKPQGGKYEISFSIEEYMRIIGVNMPQDGQQKQRKRNEMQKRLQKELLLLQAIRFTHIAGEDFESVSPVCRTAAKSGNITIEFSRPFAEYLLKKPKTIIPPQFFQISARNRTAYAIGLKCSEHYYINRRRTTQAANKLKVKTLLQNSPLPDYQKVLEGRQGWTRVIRQPLESALNELLAIGFLKEWHYEKLNGNSYQDFSNSFIYFELAAEK